MREDGDILMAKLLIKREIFDFKYLNIDVPIYIDKFELLYFNALMFKELHVDNITF